MTSVIIAGVEQEQENFDYTMQELASLVQAAGMEVTRRFKQKLVRPLAATYLGKGKAEEIKKASALTQSEILILNDELTPTQIRNLENITGLRVLDRTALILEIFATRAKTREAKLQVKIAQLQYRLPRLHTGMSNKLDQQTSGGGYTNRGAGETKLELNRRVIEKKISALNQELKTIEKEQQTRQKQRQRAGIKTVALVGYTNAGKSTILNGLLKLFGQEPHKQVFEKDMLFATLDTSVRKLHFTDNKELLLSDTVGFVSKLPHQLVKAFRTTLAEAANADLLLQVVDLSDEHYQDMIATTEKTLAEIGVTNIPMLYVFNKADKLSLHYPSFEGKELIFSARDEASLRVLAEVLKKELFQDYQTCRYLIPYTQGKFVEELNQNATVLHTEHLIDGTLITAEVSPVLAGRLAKFKQEK
ncbi:MAG: GTPase HflX [Lactobacillus sp.]|nr:GTPase HflX [Lactobacillus sp.]